MRKRNFLKNIYTVARRQHTSDSVTDDDFMYLRGVGLVSPNTPLESVEATKEKNVKLNHTLLIKTRQDYPCLDGINGSNEDYGLIYSPDVVIWTGRPYVMDSQDLFVQQGKDNHRQVSLIYEADEAEWRDAGLRDLDWKEIDNFKTAINSVEVVLEFKTAKVL